MKKILVISVAILMIVIGGIWILEPNKSKVEKVRDAIKENEMIKTAGMTHTFYRGAINVSFDKGKVYKEIPMEEYHISYEEIISTILSGIDNEINNAYLSHKKSAYALNNEDDIHILITDDKGETFYETVFKDVYVEYSDLYLNFVDDKFGYFVINYPTELPKHKTNIYITENGGKDFKQIDSLNEIYLNQVNMIGMLDEETLLVNIDGDLGSDYIIHRSSDGGDTFEEINIDMSQENRDKRMYPYSINYLDDNIMLTYKSKLTGEEIDFISMDKGKTFKNPSQGEK